MAEELVKLYIKYKEGKEGSTALVMKSINIPKTALYNWKAFMASLTSQKMFGNVFSVYYRPNDKEIEVVEDEYPNFLSYIKTQIGCNPKVQLSDYKIKADQKYHIKLRMVLSGQQLTETLMQSSVVMPVKPQVSPDAILEAFGAVMENDLIKTFILRKLNAKRQGDERIKKDSELMLDIKPSFEQSAFAIVQSELAK